MTAAERQKYQSKIRQFTGNEALEVVDLPGLDAPVATPEAQVPSLDAIRERMRDRSPLSFSKVSNQEFVSPTTPLSVPDTAPKANEAVALVIAEDPNEAGNGPGPKAYLFDENDEVAAVAG